MHVWKSSSLTALLLLLCLSFCGYSEALDLRGWHVGSLPVFNVGHGVGATSELREAGGARGRTASRGGLAYNTAQTSFNSPDKFSKDQGALAQWLGTTDLPVDNMFIFGTLGFLVGYAKSKLSKFLIAAGLFGISVFVMSKNGYVTIHWGKVQKDMAGSETYKFIKTGKAMSLLPPGVQDAISRSVGVVKSALENNKGGLTVAITSFLSGMTIGSRA